jgi:hypothetical protein
MARGFDDLLKKFDELNKKIERLGGTKFGEKTFKGFRDNIKDAEKFLRMMTKEAESLENTLENISDEFRASVRELEGQLNVTQEIKKAFNGLDSVARKLNEHKREESTLTVKQLKDLKRKIELEEKELQKTVKRFETEKLNEKLLTKTGRIKKNISKTDAKMAKAYIEAKGHLKDNESALKRINKEADELLETEKRINKTLGVTGAAFKGIQKMLGKIGIESEHFEKMNKDMREAADSGKRLKVIGAGIKGAFSGLSEALDDPVVLIGVMVKALKFMFGILNQHYKEVSAISQVYGVMGEQAEHIKEQMVAATMAGGNIYMTMEEALKATKAMSDEVGMQLQFNKENAEMYNDMVTYMGLSEKAASGLFGLSAQTGQNYRAMTDQIIQQTAMMDNQSGVTVGYARVIEQIADMSAETSMHFKGDVNAMTTTAHAAARLGMTIDQIMAATKQTLDFESSIQKEMEAEMFLQKDINLSVLQQARARNDAATVVAEQGRLLAENYHLVKDNAFAADAFADSIGMTTEQLHKYGQLQMQQGNKSLQQIKAEEEADAKALAAQEKKAQEMERSFQAAMIQLKEALLPLIEKVSGLFTGFANMVGGFFSTGGGKLLAQIIGGLAGGFLVFKAGKSLINLFTGGLLKRGNTPMLPLYVSDVAGGGNLTDTFGKFFSRNNKFARILSKPLKGLSKVFGGKSTKVGRMFRGLTARTLGSTGQFFKGKVPSFGPKMAPRIPTGPGSKIMPAVSKAFKPISKGLGTVVKKLGPIGAVLDLGLGGFTGSSQADMTAEEQKAAGVEVGISKAKATTLGVLTGGAEKGSMFSESLGIKKGSAADEAMGIAGAGARGAAIGATIGSVIPVVGTAVGAVVGGAVGLVSEGVKVFSDPNSKLRQGISNFGKSVSEGVGKAWEGTKNLAKGWWDMQKKGFKTMSKIGKKAWAGLKKGASSLWEGTKKLAKGAWEGTKNLASKAWSGVKSVGSSIAGFFGFADGGVVPGGFRAFNNGGIVKKPTIGLVGEGKMNEAVVPLPDGKNIPVNLNTQKLESLLVELIRVSSTPIYIEMDGALVGKSIASSTSEMGG